MIIPTADGETCSSGGLFGRYDALAILQWWPRASQIENHPGGHPCANDAANLCRICLHTALSTFVGTRPPSQGVLSLKLSLNLSLTRRTLNLDNSKKARVTAPLPVRAPTHLVHGLDVLLGELNFERDFRRRRTRCLSQRLR